MNKTVDLAPRNSVILVADRVGGEVPSSMNRNLVAATSTCVAIGTLSEHDGETRVELSNEEGALLSQGAQLVFDGRIQTPTRTVSVRTVLHEVVAELDVNAQDTRLRIWANDPIEPNVITILASAD